MISSCEFSLAVNEFRKVNGERKKFAHFFDFVIWDKAAEVIAEYCTKGDMIEIRATPRQDKWQDNEGRNRSRVVFRVDEFSFLPRTAATTPPTQDEPDEGEESPF
jgi:single-strand DNA-binding protein